VSRDIWADWLGSGRHGDDAAFAIALQPQLHAMRDIVLDGANLREGMQLADIGAGDGLIAFGAFARLGGALDATFVDVSAELLRTCAAEAARLGLSERCRFIEGRAEALSALSDASFDIVTSRAVVAYVADKAAAFREFYRVLRPGGRLSIGEPIFQDQALILAAIAKRVLAGDVGEHQRALEFMHRWRSHQLPDSIEEIARNPLTNFTERDLLRFARQSGFESINLRLHIDVVPALPLPWEAALRSAPLPGVPTLGELLETEFSAAERVAFERQFRELFETGGAVEQNAVAYLTANKPGPNGA
jgi:arsenite methyltransferase